MRIREIEIENWVYAQKREKKKKQGKNENIYEKESYRRDLNEIIDSRYQN